MITYCSIVDDQPHVIKHLSGLVTETPGLQLLAADTDPLVALNKILTGIVTPDIVLLDVDMPGLDGISLARQLDSHIAIVFVTAHPAFAIEAFDIGAADYLLKPIKPDAFLRAIDRARARLKNNKAAPTHSQEIFVRLDSRNLVKVQVKDIVYIEADDKRIRLHTQAERPISVLRTLNNIEAALPATDFARVHKSYLVNLKHIGGIVGKTVILDNGQVLNVGPAYAAALYKRLNII